MKYFIITVDTEGDNLWSWHKGELIETKNTQFIPRFQELCNEFEFKPVYLSNYEMLCDDVYCSMVKKWQEKNLCEVGLHLHAWNNPPFYDLNPIYSGNPYLIEYPEDIMREKFKVLYDLYIEKIGCVPFSHRSGRWTMNDKYFSLLKEFNIMIDCSHTPHFSWTKILGSTMGGSDYTHVSEQPGEINDVLEVPVTVRKSYNMLNGTWKHKIKTFFKGEMLQLRPAVYSVAQMKRLVDIVEKESDTNYLEFMIHSSELMPGGSPYFSNIQDIDNEYIVFNELFEYVKKRNYIGKTLKQFFSIK